MTYGYKTLKDGSIVPYPIDTQLPKNNMKLTNTEIEAIYYCISRTMDLRDEIEWHNEEQYWSEYDWFSKNINIAMTVAHKLAGYI
jgi:hypothetical protein